MDEKINKTIDYYNSQSKRILRKVNTRNNLTIDQVINIGKKLNELEYKITALEVAKLN